MHGTQLVRTLPSLCSINVAACSTGSPLSHVLMQSLDIVTYLLRLSIMMHLAKQHVSSLAVQLHPLQVCNGVPQDAWFICHADVASFHGTIGLTAGITRLGSWAEACISPADSMGAAATLELPAACSSS